MIGWLAFPAGPRYPRALKLSTELQQTGTPRAEFSASGLRVAPACDGFELLARTTTKIRGATLDGKPLPLINGRLALRFIAPPTKGFILVLDAPPGTRVTLEEDALGMIVPLPPTSMVAPGPFPGGRRRYFRSVLLPKP